MVTDTCPTWTCATALLPCVEGDFDGLTGRLAVELADDEEAPCDKPTGRNKSSPNRSSQLSVEAFVVGGDFVRALADDEEAPCDKPTGRSMSPPNRSSTLLVGRGWR